MKYYLPEESHTDLFSMRNDNMTTSDGNMTTLDGNMTTSDGNMTTLDGNMTTLSRKRLTKGQMDELIKLICVDWMSLEDIAKKIGRDYNYLRKFIIPRMLQEKIIEMLYPGTPNHPKQQYKVKD